MNKNILTAVLALLLMALTSSCSSVHRDAAEVSMPPGEEPTATLSAGKAESVVRKVAQTYKPWQNVSVKGKAKLKGLPIALNLKIYMERGAAVRISLSAPLIGEVGRMELTPDSMLLVNKRSKTYCKQETASYLARLGASITDVQDMLIGRVFLLGSGTLSEGNAPQVEVSAGAEDTWVLTPKVQPEQARYEFVLLSDGKMQAATAATLDERYMAKAIYTYGKEGFDMDLTIKTGSKAVDMTLEMDEPDFEPIALEPIRINPKWTQMSISKWLKSFK